MAIPPLRSGLVRSVGSRIRRTRSHLALVLTGVVAVAAACAGTTGTQVAMVTTTTLIKVTTTQPSDCAQMLPPEAQAAQMMWAVVDSPDKASDVLTQGTIGGIVLTGEQSSKADSKIADAIEGAPMSVVVATDEEGGGIQPFADAAGAIPGPPQQAKGTPQEAATTMGEHAVKLKELGVNVSLAPSADLGSGSGMGGRTYGTDPAKVASFIDAIVPAIQESGVLPVVKHWPGIGNGDQNPTSGLTTVPTLAELQAADLVPFQQAIDAGVPAIMVGHAEIPGLTAEGEPASISKPAIDGELRTKQGFSGLVVTDDLSKGAITDITTQDQAAELAIAAGADVVIVKGAEALSDTHDRLVDAIVSGRLDRGVVEAAVRRALTAKGITGQCLDEVSAYNAILRAAASTTTLPGDESSSENGTSSSDSSGSTSSGSNSSGSNSSGSDDESTTTTRPSSDGGRSNAVATGPPTTRPRNSNSTGSSSSDSSSNSNSNSSSGSGSGSSSGSNGNSSSGTGTGSGSGTRSSTTTTTSG
jgi:beta-N-acetylhexosaminidase